MPLLLSWGEATTSASGNVVTVIGEDGREVYSTFRDWAQDGDDRRILPVLRKFAEYCQPRKNVPFERYKFNKRTQESGESYEQYKTTLRKLSEACEFDTITPNEILRDRLIFGIHDTMVRERLLRETNLTLMKTDDQIMRQHRFMRFENSQARINA